MKKKIKKSKKIIKENIISAINEGPLDSLVASTKGHLGGMAGALGGFQLNRQVGYIDSQLNQFADKVDKSWILHGKKAYQKAQKMAYGRNKKARAIGNHIAQQLQTANGQVRQFTDQVRDFTGQQQAKQQADQLKPYLQQPGVSAPPEMEPQSRAESPKQQERFEDWIRSLGADPLSMGKKEYAKLFDDFLTKMALKKAEKSKPAPKQTPEPQIKGLDKPLDGEREQSLSAPEKRIELLKQLQQKKAAQEKPIPKMGTAFKQQPPPVPPEAAFEKDLEPAEKEFFKGKKLPPVKPTMSPTTAKNIAAQKQQSPSMMAASKPFAPFPLAKDQPEKKVEPVKVSPVKSVDTPIPLTRKKQKPQELPLAQPPETISPLSDLVKQSAQKALSPREKEIKKGLPKKGEGELYSTPELVKALGKLPPRQKKKTTVKKKQSKK